MNTELELKDYILIVRKRIWLIAVLTAVAVVATGAVSYVFLDPVYEASTKLIVNKTSSTSLQPLDLNDVNLNIRLIDTYKEIIKTNAIMDKVAEENPEFQLTGDQLIAKVKIESVNNSQVMTVKVQDNSYRRAAEIANAISRVFQREVPHILRVDNVTILNEADVDKAAAPVKPKPLLNMVIAFIVAVMAGVGLALLLEYLDDTIKTEEDVTRVLGLPTLAVIYQYSKEDLQFVARDQRAITRVGEKANATIHH